MSGIANSVGNVVDYISNATTDVIQKATDSIGDFIEFIAVMIITSCIIPVVVFIILIWGSKLIFNLEYDFEDIKNKYKNRQIKAIKLKKTTKQNEHDR